jgi:hypothetical protein
MARRCPRGSRRRGGRCVRKSGLGGSQKTCIRFHRGGGKGRRCAQFAQRAGCPPYRGQRKGFAQCCKPSRDRYATVL